MTDTETETDTDIDCSGLPESWHCIDCGFDTAPGCLGREQMEQALAALRDAHKDGGVEQEINDRCEVYQVRDAVWAKAGMTESGGCLCIGCLEKRLGRRLKPKDFQRGHAFNADNVPGTARLLDRRGRPKQRPEWGATIPQGGRQ